MYVLILTTIPVYITFWDPQLKRAVEAPSRVGGMSPEAETVLVSLPIQQQFVNHMWVFSKYVIGIKVHKYGKTRKSEEESNKNEKGLRKHESCRKVGNIGIIRKN